MIAVTTTFAVTTMITGTTTFARMTTDNWPDTIIG